jgi:NAD+ synthase
METATKTLDYTAAAEGAAQWLKGYAEKARANGFVMGVSGGIDSAVVSTLAAKTGLKVLILEMPIHQGSAEVDRAKNHIKWLKGNYPNVESEEIDLTDAYDILYEDYAKGESILGLQIMQDEYDFSMANTRSRLRMTTLYQFAGMYKMLVAGTGNKVEDFGIGFYTKYGDGGVDISPIADLMKSEVYALGAELGINEDILTAAPTDGLHDDGRTDEDQIGATYDELEWAMHWIADHLVTEQSIRPWHDDSDDSSLTERQKEVLEIYKTLHNSNKHKMNSIPVYDTSKFRN